ncbi:MAG: aldo/keto reductase family protein [Candidatus Berkiella sp.]
MLTPKIIYGTAWKKEQTAALVIKAVKNGFRAIDTACQPKHYNEPGVGQALKELEKSGITRDKLFLQTKFTDVIGQDPNSIPYDSRATLTEQVQQSFAISKQNLNTDYIDSLVLHSPLQTQAKTMEAWTAMEKIYHEGEVNQLGISNCYDLNELKQLCKEADIKPTIVQNRFYHETNFDKELRVFCHENNIIYQSFWTLTANPALLNSEVISQISDDINKTVAQVLFRYLSLVGVVPLTGTKDEKHMLEDLAIFDFTLTQNDLNKISNLL